MITEQQVIQSIIISLIVEHDKSIMIFCPRMKICVRILQRFYELCDEVPDWLLCGFSYKTKTFAHFDNGIRIFTGWNSCAGRGLALSRIYIHEDVMRSGDYEECRIALYPSVDCDNSRIIEFS